MDQSANVSEPIFRKTCINQFGKGLGRRGKANIPDAKMTTSANPEKAVPVDPSRNQGEGVRLVGKIIRARLTRELLIVLAFCLMTAAMTWPYVSRLRSAVSGRNDPYLSSYLLWWDYHATFTDPLSLFHPNIFYPYRYALGFSEQGYGISLLFFPLFALGFKRPGGVVRGHDYDYFFLLSTVAAPGIWFG